MGYDTAGEFLKFAYNNIKPRTMNWRNSSQGKFTVVSTKSYQIGTTGLDNSMFVYTPTNCEKGGCRALFMFHGCNRSYRKATRLWAERTGFLEYAASNDIVVVFP